MESSSKKEKKHKNRKKDKKHKKEKDKKEKKDKKRDRELSSSSDDAATGPVKLSNFFDNGQSCMHRRFCLHCRCCPQCDHTLHLSMLHCNVNTVLHCNVNTVPHCAPIICCNAHCTPRAALRSKHVLQVPLTSLRCGVPSRASGLRERTRQLWLDRTRLGGRAC